MGSTPGRFTWLRGIGERVLVAGSDGRRPLVRHVNAWLFLAVVLLGLMAGMDHLTALKEPAARRPVASAAGARRGRMFVLLVDSLRWQTAMDAGLMPTLAALRARGAYGRFIPSRDAVTVPSIRAAFSGRERTSVLGFVENLSHRDHGVESLFTEARAAGLPAVAYSEGSFLQFGTRTLDLLPNEPDAVVVPAGGEAEAEAEETPLREGETLRQDAAFRAALEDFRSGRHDLVVVHLTYSDHAAHRFPVGSSSYEAVFRHVDEDVRAAAEAVRADETLLVMGDHGHDERGRHLLGLDVPTAGVYRGPAFREGIDLGTLHNTAHRYLVSAALGLPLATYDGARPIEALAPPVSSEYAALPGQRPHEPGIPAARRSRALALAAYAAALGVLWVVMLLTPVGLLGTMGAWAAAAPLAFPQLLPWSAMAGVLAVIGCLVALRSWSMRPQTSVAVVAGAAIVGLAFFACGTLVLAHQPMTHPGPGHVAPWLVVLVVAWAMARRWGTELVGWLVFGLSLFLFLPTLYTYSAPGVMAPAWLVWLALQLVPPRGRPFAPTRAQLVLVAAAALPLSQFLLPDATNFHFDGWHSGANLMPHGWFFLAAGGLLVIFVDPGRRLRGRPMRPRSVAAGIGAAAFVLGVHSGRLPLRRAELACAVALAAAALLLRAPRWSDLRRLAWLGAGLVAMHAFIRVEPNSYYWADTFLAVVVLSADLVVVSHPGPAPSRQAFLLIMGAMAVGWSMFTWSISQLEWNFLYEWMDAPTVEHGAVILWPLIVARFAIPLLLVRYVLAERFAEQIVPLRSASLFVGAKALTVVLVACGAGWVSVETDVYLSAAHQGTIWLIALAGLV